MKHLGRLVLLVLALAVGGGLGQFLLAGFEPMKVLIFFAACSLLGNVFYQIDRHIRKDA